MPRFVQAKQIVYKSEREVRRALIQVTLYICFLTATTIIALSTQHVLIFYFNQAIERTFISGPAKSEYGSVDFKDIVTVSEWWEFIRGNFIKQLDINLLVQNEAQINQVSEKEKDDENEDNKNADTDEKDKDNGDKVKDDDDRDRDKDRDKDKAKDEGDDKKNDEDKGKQKTKKRKKRDKIIIPPAVQALIIPDNFLLGVPKLRQIRVKKNSCPVHEKFRTYFETCYADYKFSSEDKQQYYKSTRYYSRLEYKATPVFGNLLKYDGPGYMVFLGYTMAENVVLIDELIKTNWIDIATRVVILEFVIYNANTHLFNNIKIMAEILPTGGVLPKWSFDIVPLYTIWSPMNLKTLLSAVIFYLLVVYYTSVEMQELLKEGFRDYFGNAQNYVDITILLTAYIALSLTMMHPFQLDSYISRITRNPKTLVSLDETCFWFFSYIYIMAVCVFMVWAKVFRFVGFNKTLLQFSTTLRRCFTDILGFAAMFFVVFIAFALFGNMVFGNWNPDFSTFQGSLFSMVRMVLGDFPYERIEKANRVLGPLFCITYVVLITFILLNMFLAIINETYSSVKNEIREDHSVLKTYIIHVLERIKNFIKRCMSPVDEPHKQEETPTSSMYKHNPQDDTRSMFEYADVPLTSVGMKGRTSRRMRQIRTSEEAEEFAAIDDFNQDVKRVTERIDVVEETLDRLSANINRISGR